MRYVCIALLCGACGSASSRIDARPEAPPPTLSSVSPSSGIVTTMVTVSGTGFGDTQGTSTVTLGGVSGTVATWSSTSITVAVPNIKPAAADVVVTVDGSASAPQKFRVILPPRAYVHNQSLDTMLMADNVAVLSYDSVMKKLVQIPPNISTGMAPVGFGGCDHSIVVHEATRRLFVTSNTGIAVYDIDPVMGTLLPVPGSPFLVTGASSLFGLEVNKAGTRVWAALTGHIAVFDVGPQGTLTAVAGSPFVTIQNDVIALSNDERFIYANTEGMMFGAFTTDTYAPVMGSPYSQAAFTFYMARRPTTEQIFLPGANGVSVWQPDTTGKPSQITGSPFLATKPPGGTNNSISFTSDGSRAYITAQGSTYIVEVSLAADGTPTTLPGSPVNTTPLTSITCDAVSNDGSVLVVLSASASVGVFALAADGTATQFPGSPFPFTAQAFTSGLALTF